MPKNISFQMSTYHLCLERLLGSPKKYFISDFNIYARHLSLTFMLDRKQKFLVYAKNIMYNISDMNLTFMLDRIERFLVCPIKYFISDFNIYARQKTKVFSVRNKVFYFRCTQMSELNHSPL